MAGGGLRLVRCRPCDAACDQWPGATLGGFRRWRFHFCHRSESERAAATIKTAAREGGKKTNLTPAHTQPQASLPPLAMIRLLLLACTAGAALASDVLDLTDDNFEDQVGEHGLMLVEFFAPWCGHCKRLAPEYEAAATRLKGKVPLAKVDCTASTNTCTKYGVSGYPTLKLFRDGEESGSYDGPRTADGIVSQLKKQAGPSSVEIASAEAFESFINDADASVIGFFKDSASASQADFLKAASGMRENNRFAHTNIEALLEQYEIENEGIILFRPPKLANKFESSSVQYTEEKFTNAKIKKFVLDNIFGICPHMTEDNKDQLRGKDLLVAYYDVDYEKNPKGSNYWRNRVMKVAQKFLNAGEKLNFAVASHKIFNHELTEFGLDAVTGDVPVVAIKTKKDEKYVMQEEFSRDGKTLDRFLEDYFAGKLKRYLKSEPIPESNDGPVQVVVAENFDDIVNDETKDVLIEFYAPWCGHCKSLEPKYKELGDKVSSDSNIVIAKMDATANDVPSPYEVQGFPTLYFAPMGKKQSPKRYEGGREVSDFMNYLKKESTHPLAVAAEEKKSKKKKDKEDL